MAVDHTLRALNRFGLGARVGERERLREPRLWLEQQLDGAASELSVEGLPTREQVGLALQRLRVAQRDRQRDTLEAARAAVREIAVFEARAALTERITTARPFVERLVAFWSNHLCISTDAKPQLAALAGLYQREAIRPQVLGRFEDMVLASAHHAAMLIYLDNAQSVGPSSQAALRTSRRGRTRGLNENYARELMELHTLGVSGGYSQDDVIALARILTGWTVNAPEPGKAAEASPIDFAFRPELHEPGPKTLLGTKYDQGGAQEGELAIRDLCRRPATAAFVSRKLAQHFVSDDPPARAVEAIAATFRDTRGDLREVSLALVRLPAAWDTRERKFRTRHDWTIAVMRALDVQEAPAPMPQLLRSLRQPLWAPSAPKGYGDARQEWLEPDAIMNRAEIARTIARSAARSGTDPQRLLDVVEPSDASTLAGLLSDHRIAADERLALALGGPAFQWR